MRKILFLLAAALPLTAAETAVSFEGEPALKLANDKLALTILKQGTGIARIVLRDDPDARSPLWDPLRMARELGQPLKFNPGTGHFLCVDGFGPVSAEERAAGFPGHGEAHQHLFAEDAIEPTYVRLTATLPMVQENVTRTYRLAPGEQVVAVETRIESMIGFDRPLQWAEHATVGAPFLEPGVTLIDMSATRGKTRPYKTGSRSGEVPHLMPSDVDFQWPMAPGLNGKKIDLRLTPNQPNSGDHTAQLMDPARSVVWVTAANPKQQLLIGYCFRRQEFPWVQSWELFPPSGKLARGLEFSTQPFDVPRREVVTQGSLFGAPTYRWLPAKSSIGAKFLLFYTRIPAGWTGTGDVRIEGGAVVIHDRRNKSVVKLPTTETLAE